MKRIRNIILADLRYYYFERSERESQSIGIINIARAIIDIDFRVLLYWRISMELASKKYLKYIAIVIYYRLKSRYAVDLSPWAVVDPGIRIMHAFGIVIGPEVRLHGGVKIFHQVTLGKSRPDNKDLKMPSICGYCILGAGSRILGPVEIPEGTLVPANYLLTKRTLSTEPGMLAAVSPDWRDHVESIVTHS